MNTNRTWTLGAVVAILAVFGAAVGLGVQPHLAAAAAADQSAASADAQNQATGVEVARLSRAAASESKLEATAADLQAAVPPGLRMNSLSKMLQDAAALDGVTIQAFTPAAPVVYAPPATSAAPTDAGAAPAPSSTASATPAPTATAVTPDPKSPWFGVTDPLVTPADFTVIPVTVTVRGAASGVTAFATDAQQLRRLFAVTTVTTTRNDADGSTTGVLAGYVYTQYK